MEDPKPLDTGLLEPALSGDPEALGAIQKWINEIVERKGVNRSAFLAASGVGELHKVPDQDGMA